MSLYGSMFSPVCGGDGGTPTRVGRTVEGEVGEVSHVGTGARTGEVVIAGA